VAFFCNPASGGRFSSTAIAIIKCVKKIAVAQAKVTHILRPGKASEKTPKGVILPSLCEISQNASRKKKRLNANGQIASASATAQSDPTADFQEFQAFKKNQRQQQRHQQQQQRQNEECAQIASDFVTWTPFDTCNAITEIVSNVNACTPTPPLFLHLKPIRKPTFRIQVLTDTGATRSLISLSTATKHRCEIKDTYVCLSAANMTKIDVAGMTSLQVVVKGQLVHTIVAIVLQNVTQTIVGWKDLMAMGVISSDWPAMLQQEDKIPAADYDDEEKQLCELKIQMLNKYNTVFSDTINEKPIAGSPMKIHLRDNIKITPQK
jgi:hypothetical protein